MAAPAKHTLPCGVDILDIAMHPSEPMFGAALIDGRVLVQAYGTGELVSKYDSQLWNEHSARALVFPRGAPSDLLVAGSSSGELVQVDLATGKAIHGVPDAHEHPITCATAVGTEGLYAVADEGGWVKLWDPRSPTKAVRSWQPHTDYVSDVYWCEGRQSLLTVSGDGTLARMDPKFNKVQDRSEDDVDDELLSVLVVKQGRKIVCGTTTGVLNIWSWGYWNDCSDRFPGHPESTETLVKLDEDTIISGSSDGLIRVCSIQPNKLLGVLGSHSEYPIERLALNFDGSMLASASHDQSVKLWDLTADSDVEEEKHDNDDGKDEEKSEEALRAGDVAESSPDDVDPPDTNSSGSDNSEASSTDDSDSDSDAPDGNNNKRKNRSKRQSKAGGKLQKRRNTFFDGLV